MPCKRQGRIHAKSQWQLCNRKSPNHEIIQEYDLKLPIRVMLTIEKLIGTKWNGSVGTLSMMIGMAAMSSCQTKMHHVINRLWAAPSFDTVDRIQKRLTASVENSPKGTLTNLPRHEIAVF